MGLIAADIFAILNIFFLFNRAKLTPQKDKKIEDPFSQAYLTGQQQ